MMCFPWLPQQTANMIKSTSVKTALYLLSMFRYIYNR